MLSLPEKQIYILAISLMAGIFVAAMVRLWLLRREEERLLKNRAALEEQVVLQQKDLQTVRQESNAWRMEMQRQFDLFRHMASDQLGMAEKHFNELLAKSTRREYELQTGLDIAKQMCAELPAVKARVLYLESLPAITTAPVAAVVPEPTANLEVAKPVRAPATLPMLAPMPDLESATQARSP